MGKPNDAHETGRPEAGRDKAEPAAPRQVPRREIADPTVLRAMAHPTRLRLLEKLYTMERATATELAEGLGMSPANCSWHLRQLAKHGFVEEAGGGTGRQRPWRVVVQSLSVADPEEESVDFAAARDTLIEVLMGRELEAWRAWRANEHREPKEWREASAMIQSNFVWLTAEELAAFKADLRAAYERHVQPHIDRIGSPDRPVGSRATRIVAWAIPAGEPYPGPAGTQSGSDPHAEES